MHLRLYFFGVKKKMHSLLPLSYYYSTAWIYHPHHFLFIYFAAVENDFFYGGYTKS